MNMSMHLPLLESVPNISVGRDVVRVDGIVDAARDGIAHGARRDGSRAVVADVHRDSDHDRSVITIVGAGEALACGLEQLARAAIERIDLRDADGVHPRIGALDVLPIIPLDDDEDAARAAAHGLARRLAGAIGGSLGVPVVRYGLDQQGTRIPGAGSTGEVRRGGMLRVAERIESGELDLAAGPHELHPSAGITICGVRDVLVAFNVDLDVDDVGTARAIAARIRDSAGGDDALPGVRALGLRLGSRGVAQVSTNVERHRDCGPARVLEAVARIAEEFDGIGVSAAELVGLAPDSALMPLRYACTRLGVPLHAASDPSLDAAMRRVHP